MKKTLIIIVVIAAMAVYAYAGLSVKADDSLLVQSGENSNLDIITQKFINQINVLNSVSLKTSIFDEASFQSLVDWSRPIPEEAIGRPNPFAPLN